MNTACNGLSKPVDVQIGLERVDLAAEGVATNADVDAAEAMLVGTTVDDLGGEQDHARASPEGRHSGAQAGP